MQDRAAEVLAGDEAYEHVRARVQALISAARDLSDTCADLADALRPVPGHVDTGEPDFGRLRAERTAALLDEAASAARGTLGLLHSAYSALERQLGRPPEPAPSAPPQRGGVSTWPDAFVELPPRAFSVADEAGTEPGPRESAVPVGAGPKWRTVQLGGKPREVGERGGWPAAPPPAAASDDIVGEAVPDGPPTEVAGPPGEVAGALDEVVGPPVEAAGPPGEVAGPPVEVADAWDEVAGPAVEAIGPPGGAVGPPVDAVGLPGETAGPPSEVAGAPGGAAGASGVSGRRDAEDEAARMWSGGRLEIGGPPDEEPADGPGPQDLSETDEPALQHGRPDPAEEASTPLPNGRPEPTDPPWQRGPAGAGWRRPDAAGPPWQKGGSEAGGWPDPLGEEAGPAPSETGLRQNGRPGPAWASERPEVADGPAASNGRPEAAEEAAPAWQKGRSEDVPGAGWRNGRTDGDEQGGRLDAGEQAGPAWQKGRSEDVPGAGWRNGRTDGGERTGPVWRNGAAAGPSWQNGRSEADEVAGPAWAPERSAPERSAPERSAPERSAPERSAPERSAPERSAPEPVAAELPGWTAVGPDAAERAAVKPDAAERGGVEGAERGWGSGEVSEQAVFTTAALAGWVTVDPDDEEAGSRPILDRVSGQPIRDQGPDRPEPYRMTGRPSEPSTEPRREPIEPPIEPPGLAAEHPAHYLDTSVPLRAGPGQPGPASDTPIHTAPDFVRGAPVHAAPGQPQETDAPGYTGPAQPRAGRPPIYAGPGQPRAGEPPGYAGPGQQPRVSEAPVHAGPGQPWASEPPGYTGPGQPRVGDASDLGLEPSAAEMRRPGPYQEGGGAAEWEDRPTRTVAAQLPAAPVLTLPVDPRRGDGPGWGGDTVSTEPRSLSLVPPVSEDPGPPLPDDAPWREETVTETWTAEPRSAWQPVPGLTSRPVWAAEPVPGASVAGDGLPVYPLDTVDVPEAPEAPAADADVPLPQTAPAPPTGPLQDEGAAIIARQVESARRHLQAALVVANQPDAAPRLGALLTAVERVLTAVTDLARETRGVLESGLVDRSFPGEARFLCSPPWERAELVGRDAYGDDVASPAGLARLLRALGYEANSVTSAGGVAGVQVRSERYAAHIALVEPAGGGRQRWSGALEWTDAAGASRTWAETLGPVELEDEELARRVDELLRRCVGPAGR